MFKCLSLSVLPDLGRVSAAGTISHVPTSSAGNDEATTRGKGGSRPGAMLKRFFQPKTSGGTDFHGGIRTRSHTGFDLRVTSSDVKPAPQLHDSDEPRVAHEEVSHPRPKTDIVQPEPAPSRTPSCLALRIDDEDDEMSDSSTLVNPEEFPDSDEDGDARAEFATLLAEIAALPGIRATNASGIDGLAIECIARAVKLACREGKTPLADATRALRCLRRIDLLAAIRSPHEDGNLSEKDVARAWMIAQHLEITPIGFAALKALTMHGSRIGQHHATLERHDDLMLHAYLQATREKTAEERRPGGVPLLPTPWAVAAATQSQRTVLDKCICQIRNRLAASHRHALSHPDEPFEYRVEKNQHEWAIGFVRNGLYTDQLTVDGQPTPFALIEGRLGKATTWFERASRPLDVSLFTKAWRFARQVVAPAAKKSPLHAYNRLGDGWWFDKTSGACLGHVGQGVVHDGRAFREGILGNLIKGLKACGSENGEQLRLERGGDGAEPDPVAIRNLARLAVLTEVERRSDFLVDLLHGEEPDALTKEAAAGHMEEWLGRTEDQSRQTREAIASAMQDATQPLTLSRLRDWAAELPDGPRQGADVRRRPSQRILPPILPPIRKSSADEWTLDSFTGGSTSGHTPWASAAPQGPGQPDWNAFNKAVAQLTTGQGEAAPTPHFGKLGDTPDKFAVMGEVFENVVTSHELGSKFTLTSGGYYGAGFKELTRLLSTYLSFGTFRPRLDASLVRKRSATLMIETNAAGNQIFLGTRRAWKQQFGGGCGAGPGAKIKGVGGAKAGITFDTYESTETPNTRGVLLRIPRPPGGGLHADRANNRMLGHLLRKHVIERHAPAGSTGPRVMAPGDDGSSILKNMMQECSSLIVNWKDYDTRIDRVGTTIKAGATATLGPLTAGPAAGLMCEAVAIQDLRKSDILTLEATQRQNHILLTHGTRNAISQAGGVNTLRYLPSAAMKLAGHGTEAGFTERLTDVTKGLLDEMVTMSQELHRSGTTTTDTLVFENGAILKQSNRMITHLTADSMIASVEPKLDCWAAAKARRQRKDLMEAGGHHCEAAYRQARASLRAQLDEAKTNADANTQYTECRELTDAAVRTINALLSAATVARQGGDDKGEEAWRNRVNEVLADEDAWEPHSLWTQFATMDERTPPALSFGAYLGQTDAVTRTSMKILS